MVASGVVIRRGKAGINASKATASDSAGIGGRFWRGGGVQCISPPPSSIVPHPRFAHENPRRRRVGRGGGGLAAAAAAVVALFYCPLATVSSTKKPLPTRKLAGATGFDAGRSPIGSSPRFR